MAKQKTTPKKQSAKSVFDKHLETNSKTAAITKTARELGISVSEAREKLT